MTSALSCPSPEKVQDLLANRLPAAEAAALRQHLRDCPVCQERLRADPSAPTRFDFLAPPRAPGELGWLDSYRIVGQLGEGGMAIVFDAEDTVLHRRVALKVLRPDLADPSLRQRFLREARLLASLSHENVVALFQVGEQNGIPYMAMERLEGMTLEAKLKRDRWLPLAEALSLARQTAEGLAVLHEHGVVHRDVKPANLWLEFRDGRFCRVKLIDFGIARPVQGSSQLTQVGQFLGTLGYVAPEQAAGQTVDARADLYSMGCLLFHVLTGQPPLAGKRSQTQTLLREIVTGRTVIVRDRAPQLPAPVAGLIQELLSRNPSDRPASARLLVKRLQQLEHDARLDTVPTAPADTAPQIQRLRRRPSALSLWLGGLTLLAAVIVSVVAGWQKIATHHSTQPETPKQQSGGPPEPAGELPPLKVGILHSLKGNLSGRERPIVHALDLAIEEINAAGGVLGRQIKPIDEDGASDPEVFAHKAQQLIEKDQVEVIFGCWSSAARKRVLPICEKHDRLLFYAAACEGLESSPNVVYLGGTPNQTGLPALRWLFQLHRAEIASALAQTAGMTTPWQLAWPSQTLLKGPPRFYLVGSEEVCSRGTQTVLEHQIESEGGTLWQASLPLKETDFGPVVADIKKRRPDVIVNTSDDYGLLAFLRALRRGGIGPPTTPTVWCGISENELSSYPIELLKGDYAVGCYFSSLDRASNQAFLQRFRKRYGDKERVNDDMQTAYFGVYLWKAAVMKAGRPDTGAVRKALRGLTVEAPEGPIRIDATTQHADRTALLGLIADPRSLPQFQIVYRSSGPLSPDPFPAWRSRGEWEAFVKKLYDGWGRHWEKQD